MKLVVPVARPCTTVFVDEHTCPQYYNSRPHLSFPAEGIVRTLDELMLRVQQGVQPRVTWHRVDLSYDYRISLSWQGPRAQLMLVGSVDYACRGLNVSLYPCLGDVFGRSVEYVAAWSAHRVVDSIVQPEDNGKLAVNRGQRVDGRYRVTDLDFEVDVFQGTPRSYFPRAMPWRRAESRKEFGADIIEVLQQELRRAGLA